MGDNTGDKLTINMMLNALEYEATLGRLWYQYQTVKTIDTEELICKYVYSNKYYFEYNTYAALWKEIPINTMISRLEGWISNACLIIAREELSATISDAEQYKLLLAKTLKVRKLKYLENVIKIITDDLTNDDIFNKLDKAKPFYLPIRGERVINLLTKQIRPRRIDDYFTFECPVIPATKYSPFFLNAMNNIMCNNAERIQYFKKVLGYCLTGDTSAQAFFIWHGKGSNGKSLILNLLGALLNKAYKPISKSVIIDCGKMGQAGGSELISLKDLRVGSFSETSKMESLNAGLIKTLSGGDTITARALYKEPIEFQVFLKLIICTNHKPEFESDDGMIRRIKLIPFEAKFTRATPNAQKFEYPIIENLERVLIDSFLDEFFLYCLEGVSLWEHDKGFNIVPHDVAQQQNNYIRDQNSFITWHDEFIIKDESSKLNRPFTYDHYKKYCDDEGLKSLNKRAFFEKLTEELGPKTKSNGAEVHKGYKIKVETTTPFIETTETNRDILDA